MSTLAKTVVWQDPLSNPAWQTGESRLLKIHPLERSCCGRPLP